MERLSKVLNLLRATGVSFTVIEILVFLTLPGHKEESAVSVKDLATALGLNKPAVSRATGMLVKFGYMTTRQSKDDRRRVILHRSGKGEVLARQLEKVLS